MIKQNAGCHFITDCAEGELLSEYIRRQEKVKKEEMFSYVKQLMRQLENIQKVKEVKSYRYVTPFSIVLKKNKEIALLDFNAQSNRYILNQIVKENICNQFFKETMVFDDIYSFGKTIQYLLATTKLVPPLKYGEERKLKQIISKCLSDNSKKQYSSFSEILLEFPQLQKKRKKRQVKKTKMIFIIIVIAIIGVIGKQYIHGNEQLSEEKVDFFEIGMTYFLELDDYQKSMEMFEKETENPRAKIYREIAAYMNGETWIETEEIEKKIRTIEEVGNGIESLEEKRAILKVYANLDTRYARERCLEIGKSVIQELRRESEDVDHMIEKETREIMVAIYEKNKEYKNALIEYEEICKWFTEEEIYCTMLRIAGETEEKENISKIYEQGIRDNPSSKTLRIRYLQIQHQVGGMEEEMVKRMITECPELLEDSEFKKLQEESGIKIEGENIWVEK